MKKFVGDFEYILIYYELVLYAQFLVKWYRKQSNMSIHFVKSWFQQ